MSFDLPWVRSQFPGLREDEVLLDNAGGSLTLARVADRVRDYLLHTDVQLGATYERSAAAAERFHSARVRLAEFVGASRSEEIVFGPSSTILLKFLAQAMRGRITSGDEIVVTRVDHEANIGCWTKLAQERGATVRFWEPMHRGELDLEGLDAVLTDRTRLVAVTHVSNITGSIQPIEAITRRVHERGARICVDGVAFAPHRPLDVLAWGVDYYVFSLYKVFGPHHAILYGKHEALVELDSINHYFVAPDQVPLKMEPGNANYELSHGAAAIPGYLEDLGRRVEPDLEGAAARALAWDAIAQHEAALAERLLAWLRNRADVMILGTSVADPACRVPTVSFVHETMDSKSIVDAVDPYRIGIRHGHFYAKRLIDQLGLGPRNGVVRASMVHYNTMAEMDRLIEALDKAMAS